MNSERAIFRTRYNLVAKFRTRDPVGRDCPVLAKQKVQLSGMVLNVTHIVQQKFEKTEAPVFTGEAFIQEIDRRVVLQLPLQALAGVIKEGQNL